MQHEGDPPDAADQPLDLSPDERRLLIALLRRMIDEARIRSLRASHR